MSSCSVSPPAAARELLARRAARDDILAFAHRARPGYVANWHHRVIAEYLARVDSGELRRLIVCMPPRHGKTELVSRCWPAWLLGREPRMRIIAASHTASLSEHISRDVKRIVASSGYRAVFPETRLPDRRSAFKSTDAYWELPNGGGYRAAGVRGPLTGHGFDVGIIDDPFKNRDEADSHTIRDKVWEWFTNVFYTRAEPNAAIVIISTRWHRDDLVGRLLRQAEARRADQYACVTLPAIATSEPTPDDPRAEGEELWPDRYSSDALDAIRAQDPRAFACLYQQDPSAAGGTEWPTDLFGECIWVDDAGWPDSYQITVVAIDPSKGRQDRDSDYSAIVTLGLARGLLWVDADLERRPPHQIVDDAMRICERAKPDLVGIESNQFQELLVHEFERACGQHFGVRWPVYKIDNRVNKAVRIRRLGQYIARREMRFRRSPGARLLVDQLMDFPFGEHDDGPDALEMAIRLILEHKGGGYGDQA